MGEGSPVQRATPSRAHRAAFNNDESFAGFAVHAHRANTGAELNVRCNSYFVVARLMSP
jgi:uncharacterized MAPEG superfamily protein